MPIGKLLKKNIDMSKLRSKLNELNWSIDIGDTGIKFMKVLKYSNMDEVRRIMDKLQVVMEGEVIVGVVGISQDDNVVDIGPLAVDRKFQVPNYLDGPLKLTGITTRATALEAGSWTK